MPRNYPVPSAGPLDSTTGAQRSGIILPSASRGTGATNSQEFVNISAKGVRLFIDITNVGGAGTLIVKVQNLDPASQNWVDIPNAVTASLNAVATKTLTILPGNAETANEDIADPLGIRWRVVATVGTNAVTFSVGGDYLDA